jgi:hypothetical protein
MKGFQRAVNPRALYLQPLRLSGRRGGREGANHHT